MLSSAKDNRGFTLIELMMTAAVLGIFFGVVYGFLNHNLRFLARRGGEHDASLQARIAMYRVSNLMREYEKLEVDDVNKVVRGDGIDLVNYNKNETNPEDNSVYHFYWDAAAAIGQLRKTSNNNVIADGIKEFKVEPPSANVITLTVQAVPAGDTAGTGLTLSTELRADRQHMP